MLIIASILLLACVLVIGYAIVAAARRKPEAAPAPPPNPERMALTVEANGREHFTPLPLQQRRVYRLTVRGVYTYQWYGLFCNNSGGADAKYYQDEAGSFTHPYAGLRIRNKVIREYDGWTENRYLHEYSVLVEGFGSHDPVQLVAPKGLGLAGALAVEIELLPPDTPLPSDVRAAERAAAAAKEAAEAAERQAEEHLRLAAADEALRKQRVRERRRQRKEQVRQEAEQRQREQEGEARRQVEAERAQQQALAILRESEAQEAARLDQTVEMLKRKVHQNRNVFDRKFRSNLVQQYGKRILTEWRERWTREYDELFGGDKKLLEKLRAQAPEVLKWHEHQIDMILLAERLAVQPAAPLLLEKPRPITSRTVLQVQRSIDELFRLRQEIDRTREAQVAGSPSPGHEGIERATRTMSFHFDLLKVFGIAAKTPEQAEDQFFCVVPYLPPLGSYEQLIERMQAGHHMSPDALKGRLEDLFVEEIVLQQKRKRLVRKGWNQGIAMLDARLLKIRQYSTVLRDFLTSLKVPLEFLDDRTRQQTVEQEFYDIMSESNRMQDFAREHGQPEVAEYIHEQTPGRLAKLFEDDEQSYT